MLWLASNCLLSKCTGPTPTVWLPGPACPAAMLCWLRPQAELLAQLRVGPNELSATFGLPSCSSLMGCTRRQSCWQVAHWAHVQQPVDVKLFCSTAMPALAAPAGRAAGKAAHRAYGQRAGCQGWPAQLLRLHRLQHGAAPAV